MSEVVRSYTTTLRGGTIRYRRRRRGCFPIRWLFLILVLALAGTAYWFSRDTHSVAEYMPAGRRLNIAVGDALAARERLAQSAFWAVLPPGTALDGAKEMMAEPIELAPGIPAPRWILDNLFHQTLYITGNDLQGFSDIILLTKTTVVGCLLEKVAIPVTDIALDNAGGLGLRTVPGQGFYYTVRGRVLIASASRDALVSVLTLSPEEALPENALEEMFDNAGAEDLRGALLLDEGLPPGEAIERVRFAVRAGKEEITVKCTAELRPPFRECWSALLEEAAPSYLKAPPEGLIALSANFGKPVAQVWAAIGAGLGNSRALWPSVSDATLALLTEEAWNVWANPAGDSEIGMPEFMAALLGPCGPGIRLCWRGIDVNEILPVPEVVGTFDAPDGVLDEFAGRMPKAPADAPVWASYPRQNAESGLVYLPMLGGPSIEPTAAMVGTNLLVSTSASAASELLTSTALNESLAQKGNLYLQLQPYAAIERIVAAVRLLAEAGFLRGHTPESFDASASQWLACAAAVEEVTILVAVEDTELGLDIRAVCGPARAY